MAVRGLLCAASLGVQLAGAFENIGYLTNYEAWKDDGHGYTVKGEATHHNIDWDAWSIINFSFFGVAVDGSLHSGDYRNKKIYMETEVQQPGHIAMPDPDSSWDFPILFGSTVSQWGLWAADNQVLATEQGFTFDPTNGDAPWSHPGLGIFNEPMPIPLKPAGGPPGLLEMAHGKGKKVMASLGGWSMSKHFPEMAADPVMKAKFLDGCELLMGLGFDGIDIDWEFPGGGGMNFEGGPQDYPLFEQLMEDIRARIGANALLTAAFKAVPSILEDFDWPRLGRSMDYFNMMSYDLNGGWSNKAGHNSPLYEWPEHEWPDLHLDYLTQWMVGHGIPAAKINLGAAFYGRGVVTTGPQATLGHETVKRNIDFTVDGPTMSCADLDNFDMFEGSPNYNFIEKMVVNNVSWTTHWDDNAKVPYAVNGKYFLSYDDERAVRAKAEYVRDHQLAGLIVWQIHGDVKCEGTFSGHDKSKQCSNVKQPLAQQIKEVFGSHTGPPVTTTRPPQTTPGSPVTTTPGSPVTTTTGGSSGACYAQYSWTPNVCDFVDCNRGWDVFPSWSACCADFWNSICDNTDPGAGTPAPSTTTAAPTTIPTTVSTTAAHTTASTTTAGTSVTTTASTTAATGPAQCVHNTDCIQAPGWCNDPDTYVPYCTAHPPTGCPFPHCVVSGSGSGPGTTTSPGTPGTTTGTTTSWTTTAARTTAPTVPGPTTTRVINTPPGGNHPHIPEGFLDLMSNTDWSLIMRWKTANEPWPTGTWAPSTIYNEHDLTQATIDYATTGVNGQFLWLGDDGSMTEAYKYGAVAVAAFVAQCMKETIEFDACDENNWDADYPASNSCGQLGQSYADYTPGDSDMMHTVCQTDYSKHAVAMTHAKWWGAPGPNFAAPRSTMPESPRWNHQLGGCWDKDGPAYDKLDAVSYIEHVKEEMASGQGSCRMYEGQQGGGWQSCQGGCPNADAPDFDRGPRRDVEGCYWWGRGVIQTTGVANFGLLNYYAGKAAVARGVDALYPNIDFCEDPGQICTTTEYPQLKWFAGYFYWVNNVQTYNAPGWEYYSELKKFVEGGMMFADTTFIDGTSGIVNRGCHHGNCGTGPIHDKEKRAENFRTVLRSMGLVAQ